MRATPAILAAALASAAPASAELDLNRAEVSHLSNGLTVIMLEDHTFPLVSVQMLYKSGSAAEVNGKTGLAHFMEHLAFRGSTNFPNEKATELIYDSGGEWHGYTAMDQTTYFATMPREGLDLLLKIEADRMARTLIDPESIEVEKGAVITELHSYENDPASVLQDAVTRTAIQAHPYGSPMVGYVSDVKGLTANDAQAYYSSHYAPGNAVLAIVGDFKAAQARALVSADFANVPPRPVAGSDFTRELPQRGERRLRLTGPVERRYFLFAFPAPAASSPDFPAFLVLQQILSGGSGLNLQQSGWSATPARRGSLLFGIASDLATWLPPTRDPFLFMISGSMPLRSNPDTFEHDLERQIAAVIDQPITAQRLETAKAGVARELREDVETTADAAHQLAFFEGIGALDRLLKMPTSIALVTPSDVQRVARAYLRTESSTVGWMVPGTTSLARPGASNPNPAADRQGTAILGSAASGPELRTLSGGLPAIVQTNPLSPTVTVELLLRGQSREGIHPDDLPGFDAIVRSGAPDDLEKLVAQSTAAAAGQKDARAQVASEDPATRLQQLILAQIRPSLPTAPKPVAIFVSGNVDRSTAFDILEHRLGRINPDRSRPVSQPWESGPRIVREQIAKPLSQGAIGYVVEGPKPGTRDALAWQMLLYILTHDYAGRLGQSAIRDEGIVYHIYSRLRSDGQRTWATISTGVDPDKADRMEAELRSQISRLLSEPPSSAEVDAARRHILGRDLTAAQSNEQFAAKLADELVQTGALRSHDQLNAQLMSITQADVAAAARPFGRGAIIRVDVSAAN
jgi:predicted Zn-dependent peptidase